MRQGPILGTLVALSLPNVLALTVQSVVVIAETTFIGIIGTDALAAMALVFPMIMLTQMMSSGAMGGGISSAISRSLGRGDGAGARLLAFHALIIGLAAGTAMSVIFLLAGPRLYALLGGQGSVLMQATVYSSTFFSGAIAVWMFNSVVSVVRGTGNMRLSSTAMILVAVLQIMLAGLLSLGAGIIPALGLPGIALGQVLANAIGAVLLGARLLWRSPIVTSTVGSFSLRADMLLDILKVGAVACLSPLQSILVVLIVAHLAARLGTTALAGFGIGLRLELLLVPIAFAVGIACVPMVGMAIGERNFERAKRVAWTGAVMSGTVIGAIGIIIAIFPDLWGRLFTGDEAVLAAVRQYLKVAGWAFPAYGIGLCLYFASQGSGRILGPVFAGTARLLVIGVGGWWLAEHGLTLISLAALIAIAMIVYGLATVIFVRCTSWERG